MSDLLSAYRPGIDGPFTDIEAAHFLRRTAFGGTVAELRRIRDLGPTAAAAEAVLSDEPNPEWTVRKAIFDRALRRRDIDTLKAAWFARMLTARRPLREHLALFWHDHFATSDDKVRDAGEMGSQNGIFLERGAGPFGSLLAAVAAHPAVLRWLDADTSTKEAPNENFARELFELFSLGLGRYDEKDVKEAARAFTGIVVDAHETRVDAARFDAGKKSVLGRDVMTGADVVRAAVDHPGCAPFIARKLVKEFVMPDPPPEIVDLCGAALRDVDLSIGRFLERLLASRLFYAEATRRRLHRSPVAFVVGIARTVGARMDAFVAVSRLAEMGQNLFFPPSVEGWKKGSSWISTSTLAARRRFAADLEAGARGPLRFVATADVDPAHIALMIAEPNVGPGASLNAILAAAAQEPRAHLH